MLRMFLSPAEGVEHVEEGHGDVDEDYQGEQGVCRNNVVLWDSGTEDLPDIRECGPSL